MPTKNPRINITFEETTVGLLAHLAKQEHKSVSSLAKELVLEALERREDMVLSAIAKSRAPIPFQIPPARPKVFAMSNVLSAATTVGSSPPMHSGQSADCHTDRDSKLVILLNNC